MMKVSVKSDKSGLIALKRQVLGKGVDVGYIDSPAHWTNGISGLNTAEIARDLHYHSAWGRDNPDGSFMLDYSKAQTVTRIVHVLLEATFGEVPFHYINKAIGEALVREIQKNILEAESPPNSANWAKIKGFNDPLQFGSKIGRSNTLLDSVEYRVTNGKL